MIKRKISRILIGVLFVILAIYKTYTLITSSSGWFDQLLLVGFVIGAVITFMSLEDDH